jgi:hypothetical protein
MFVVCMQRSTQIEATDAISESMYIFMKKPHVTSVAGGFFALLLFSHFGINRFKLLIISNY